MSLNRSYDGSDVHQWIGTLRQGHHIAMGKNYVVTTFPRSQQFTDGCVALNVRVPDLRRIDYILDIEFRMSPLVCEQPVYEAVGKVITGNVVGMTILGALFTTGTTLQAEVVAIGH